MRRRLHTKKRAPRVQHHRIKHRRRAVLSGGDLMSMFNSYKNRRANRLKSMFGM